MVYKYSVTATDQDSYLERTNSSTIDIIYPAETTQVKITFSRGYNDNIPTVTIRQKGVETTLDFTAETTISVDPGDNIISITMDPSTNVEEDETYFNVYIYVQAATPVITSYNGYIQGTTVANTEVELYSKTSEDEYTFVGDATVNGTEWYYDTSTDFIPGETYTLAAMAIFNSNQSENTESDFSEDYTITIMYSTFIAPYISENTPLATLVELRVDSIPSLTKSSLTNIAKIFATNDTSSASAIDFTTGLSTGQFTYVATTLLSDFRSDSGVKVPVILVNPTAYEIGVARHLSVGADGNYRNVGLEYLLATDVDGPALSNYPKNIAGIGSDTRMIYAAGIAASMVQLPTVLPANQIAVLNVATAAMVTSAQVVFNQTKVFLGDSNTSDAVAAELNVVVVGLAEAEKGLVDAAAADATAAAAVAALSVSVMVESLKSQITTLTNLVIKIQKKVKA